jgi:hypothetical protein
MSYHSKLEPLRNFSAYHAENEQMNDKESRKMTISIIRLMEPKCNTLNLLRLSFEHIPNRSEQQTNSKEHLESLEKLNRQLPGKVTVHPNGYYLI